MDKLRFYHISEEYIEYLRKYDSHVMFNKNEQRPYIGVVIRIGGLSYFAPLKSPKPRHITMSSSGPVLKLDGGSLGVIAFNNMVPVMQRQLIPFDILSLEDEKYKSLLLKQIRYCRSIKNTILKRARDTYEKTVVGKIQFYKDLCCDFRKLEECCRKYATK